MDIEAGDKEVGDIEAADVKAVDIESPIQDNEAAQSTKSCSSDHKGCNCCSEDVLKNLLYLAAIIICALIAVVVYQHLTPCPVCSTPETATCPPEATTGASTSQDKTSQDNTENKALPKRFYDENYMR